MHYFWILTLSCKFFQIFRCSLSFTVWIQSYVVNGTIRNLFCTWLWQLSSGWQHNYSTKTRQAAVPMSTLCILLCLWGSLLQKSMFIIFLKLSNLFALVPYFRVSLGTHRLSGETNYSVILKCYTCMKTLLAG